MSAPLLVFGWGNLSRGDDALGPMLIQKMRGWQNSNGDDRVEFLEDYQLQIEHALDLVGRKHVLFVDASMSCAAPFEVTELSASRDDTFTTHAVSPQSVMQVYTELARAAPPPCTLLAIRGSRFELGEPPQDVALDHLDHALHWVQSWLTTNAALIDDEFEVIAANTLVEAENHNA